MPTPADPSRPDGARERDAQAALDQMRVQAGGALSGQELNERLGRDDKGWDAPPLDWRLTPRNVILQLGAIAIFLAVVWFLASLVYDSIVALFG